MRLNHVELISALVAAIGSENRSCLWGRGDHMHAVCIQRWLATTRPPAGVAGHGLATYKGWPTAAKAPLQGGGRLRPGPLQGATSRKGGLPAKGSLCLRRGSSSGGAVRVKAG
ncbi:hypothetical protein B296_00026299 [Ensete ventricosum]|uniref:Uncharacterized protein n=1 Tax=Ensete ventricosum TaxID=4639 RepID=A0A426YEH8_ENSVE|nr:hypothetical protein B296_00026299 [Ensete ventricosum]